MSIGKIAVGVLGIGAAGFIGCRIRNDLRERELNELEAQYRRIADFGDPDIENALNELRSIDFTELRR